MGIKIDGAAKECYIKYLYIYLYMEVFFVFIRENVMLLGMSDPWVAAAYLANIAVTLVCVVYGVISYNSGDDSGDVR